jgi:hypothetical protein
MPIEFANLALLERSLVIFVVDQAREPAQAGPDNEERQRQTLQYAGRNHTETNVLHVSPPRVLTTVTPAVVTKNMSMRTPNDGALATDAPTF